MFKTSKLTLTDKKFLVQHIKMFMYDKEFSSIYSHHDKKINPPARFVYIFGRKSLLKQYPCYPYSGFGF